MYITTFMNADIAQVMTAAVPYRIYLSTVRCISKKLCVSQCDFLSPSVKKWRTDFL